MVQEYNIAHEKGDGSRSPIEDEMTGDMWETKDQRADTKTTFYEKDIDSLDVSERRKSELRRILRWQEGEQVNSEEYDSRGQQNHKEDKRRLISSFTSQLGLTPHQKRRTKHIVMDKITVNKYGNYSTEEVILGVITYVCMEDMGASGVHVDDRATFQALAEAVETNMNRIRGARKITREKLRDSL